MKLLMKVLVLLIFFTHSALFASAGKVSLLNGEAYAQRDSQKIALQNGSILEEKDVIITAKGAQVQLIFEDKTVITLGSESEFKIEEYFNDAKAPKAKFKFGQGTFKTITGQIGKTAPENFTLETKTATIGIRGTIVGGMIPPPSSPAPETIFCLSGTIFAVSLFNPQAPPVVIPAGSLTFSSPGAPPSPPRPATQQELQQINQSLGAPPPPVAGSNTPPTSGGSSGSDGSGSTSDTPTPPAPQTFIPVAASSASETNLQTSLQDTLQKQIEDLTEHLVCEPGTSGTYPNCTPTSMTYLSLSGLATSSRTTPSTEYTHDNLFNALISSMYTTGEIDIPNTSLYFTSTGADVESSSLFTLATAGDGITQLSSMASPDSHVLWGKWTSTEITLGTTLLPTENNYWVAGKTTDKVLAASHIDDIYHYTSQSTKYTYLGKSMGTVYNGSGQTFAIDPINDATNEVKLVFTFGNSAAPISYPDSHIRFTANGYWDITTYPGAAAALADGSFWAMLSGTGTIGGSLNGYFYGANAASLGGTFKATNPDTSSTAIGALVASKSGTITTLSGFGTSVYETPGAHYIMEDIVDLSITDSTSVAGTISLYRDVPPAPLIMDASSMSVSTFGLNSDYLYWGKWTSLEMNSGETLIASNDNFWVAGTNKVESTTYINNLASDTRAPILTYKGNVMGSTYDGGTRYAIDEDTLTNKVLLQFNLGETNPIDATNSLITFVSNGGTWLLKLSTIDSYFGDDGTFSSFFVAGTSSGNGSSIIDSSLNGTFYGPSANAAGGTFQATTDSGITALGVFKTIKAREFYYPTSFTPALDGVSAEGTFDFTGLATSEYVVGSTRYASTSDIFNLTMDTTSTPIIGGSIILSDSRTPFSLDSTSGDIDKMTYSNKNSFAIKDFDAAQGWIQTVEAAQPVDDNDYVSWGYWAVNSSDTSQLTTKRNYWVGGSQTDADAAISHIAGLSSTHYTYTGKVMGDVEEAGSFNAIDSATSSVQLKFDFGGGTNALYSDPSFSWIRFSANGKQWDLKPTLTTPTVTNGTFSDGLTGTVTAELAVPVTTGAIQGKFYGNQAQAVGGTFNAATATATAIGVFKAVR